MVSKRLMGFWAFFDFFLLAAGVMALVLSIVWRAPNLILNLTFDSIDLNGGTVLGVVLLASWMFSIAAIIQRNHVIQPLVYLNWVLLLDGIVILFIGTYMWFYTLHIQNYYHSRFASESSANKILIQDMFDCCGYFDATDEVAFGGTVCPNQDAATALNSFCVSPITSAAEVTLNLCFSTIYGFMIIVILLFLSNMCVIKKRQEIERFKKIDAKRGGKGFV